MKEMYKGKVNSPATLLSETIDSKVTSIKVDDASVFPEGPNLAVIGNDGNAETIKYESINNNILVGCVRGFQGEASVWDKETIISRNFTEYDLNAIQKNILELDNNKVDKVEGQGLISDSEKNKLANIEDGANKYVHPSSHSTSMIIETSSKRFVSDTEKEKWNNKVDKSQMTDDVYGRESDKIVSQKGITFMRLDLLRELQKKAYSSAIPKKLSQLENDKTFKTEAEIQELINNSKKLKKEIVESLPSSGQDDVIYLLKNKNDANNVYTEYLWINGKWEIIGDTKVDLTDYAKKDEIPKNLSELQEDNSHQTITNVEKTKIQNIPNDPKYTDTITEVVDNLTSDDSSKALSANQGKNLEINKQNKLIAGTNISIDGNNKISALDTTYSNATTSRSGLMSSKDKSELDKMQNVSTFRLSSKITAYKIGRIIMIYGEECYGRDWDLTLPSELSPITGRVIFPIMERVIINVSSNKLGISPVFKDKYVDSSAVMYISKY